MSIVQPTQHNTIQTVGSNLTIEIKALYDQDIEITGERRRGEAQEC
jgi:hypothetical protein